MIYATCQHCKALTGSSLTKITYNATANNYYCTNNHAYYESEAN